MILRFSDKYHTNIFLFRILNHLLRVLITATQNLKRDIPGKKKNEVAQWNITTTYNLSFRKNSASSLVSVTFRVQAMMVIL